MGVESDVVGVLGEGGGEEGFGVGWLVLAEEQVDEGRGGVGVGGVGLEDAAVGGFGGGQVVGGLSEFGGEEDVFGGFGRQFEGFEELCAGLSGVGLLVEAGESTESAGLEGGIGSVKGDGGGEFGVGFGEVAGAGEE